MNGSGATLELSMDQALAVLRQHPVGLHGALTFYTPIRSLSLLMKAAEIVHPNHVVVHDQGLVWVMPREE